MVLPKIIVTGAAGLVGQTLTSTLRLAGHQVVEADLSLGHDFSDESFVKDWFAENRAEHLVNLFALNDSVSSGRKAVSFMDISLADVRRVMDVNIVALLSVCREYIRNQKGGNIVNFSSIYGLVSPRSDMYEGNEKFLGYGVSKAAVVQLTRHLAIHAAPRFRVNCVVPGGIFADQPSAFVEAYSRNSPLRRMMNVDEVAGIVEFLVSDKATYCTGSVYTVDGGWTAW